MELVRTGRARLWLWLWFWLFLPVVQYVAISRANLAIGEASLGQVIEGGLCLCSL